MTDWRDVRITELEAQVAERDARIVEIQTSANARIAELERKVEEMTNLVLKLKEALDRNSRNSNKPPSSDSPDDRANRRGKGKGSGNRGGQPGHSGSTRALVPPEQVDKFENLFPAACESCWVPLPAKPDPDAQRFQTVELPQLKPHITEWRVHCVACPRCAHRTSASTTSIPASSFGPRLTSIVALLTGIYHLSRRATVSLMSDVLNVDISLGAVSAIEGRVSEAVKVASQEAWSKLDDAAVKHTDGTSWFQCSIMCALWTIATPAVTVFKILSNGQSPTLEPLFGKKQGILVSDRGKNLNFWAMAQRQICWAHLLRKAISFSERAGLAGAIGRELLDYIGIIFQHWTALKEGRLSRVEFRVLMAPVRLRVEALLERAQGAAIREVSGSCADILSYRLALWTFVDTEGVEPTNNHAERELRAFVLWRKRSFGTQSERGNLFAERMMTVAHTARKQNKNIFQFLTECCVAARDGGASPSLFAVA